MEGPTGMPITGALADNLIEFNEVPVLQST